MKLHLMVAAVLVGLLCLTGCQRVVTPPPGFEAPVVTPGVQTSPPPGPTVPATVKPGPQVTRVEGAPLIAGAALTPKVPSRQWKYIIVHHSDTSVGSAKRLDAVHRARKWDMLGYDFVIGNGSETPDGKVEVGPRWGYQLVGAHTRTPDGKYNNYGIGICLVGDFEQTRPTAKQMDSLARLCAYLMTKYNIPASRILGHRDCKPTLCPGRHMDMNQVRKLAVGYVAR